jgi:ABC-type sugar transport system substrate-binding protein
MGGELAAQAALPRLESDWQGRNLIYVGLGESTCEPCDIRVREGLAAAREIIDIPDENVVLLDTGGLTDQALTVMTDTLTAHPNDVMILVGLNDESSVGALQAIKAQNRTQDAILVSLGADRLGRDAMRNDSDGVLVAMVDFNPWAEGWTWVEAAIAVAEGETFAPYDISRVITRENIDELFPDDE